MRFSLAALTEYEIRLDFTSSHLGGVVSDHLLNTVTDMKNKFSRLRMIQIHKIHLRNGPSGFPTKSLFGSGGVGPSSLGVILGQVLVDDFGSLLVGTFLLLNLGNNFLDVLGEFLDGELVRGTNVDRSGLGTIHEQDQTVNQIVDVLERPGLGTVTVDGHVFTLQGLDDKVGDNSTIVRVHSGTEGVEDSGNSDVDAILSLVTVGQGLGDSLAFIVTSSDTDGVDVTPVFFSLGVDFRVTVDLGGGGDQESGLGSLGETEHVQGTHERGLDGLDSVVLVVRGRSGASQVVDLYIRNARVSTNTVILWHADLRSTSIMKFSMTSCRTISKLG